MVRYCGEANRLPGLFPTKSFFESAKSSFTRGLQGVANVFTQHRPLLASLLDQYIKGKLSETDFPFLTPAKPCVLQPSVLLHANPLVSFCFLF